jgi:hypothetical protein
VSSADDSTRKRAVLVAAAGVGLAFVAWLLIGWSRPPQMGADEKVTRAVDALFTAITARDEKLLAECEQRLLALKEAGKLPKGASTYLEKITRKARAGAWESAARSLYDFIRAQRRQGGHEHSRTARRDGG